MARADDTPEQFEDVDTQLLRDYPELAALIKPPPPCPKCGGTWLPSGDCEYHS